MRNVTLFFVINIVVVIGFFAALIMKTPWIGFVTVFCNMDMFLHESFKEELKFIRLL